MAKQFQCPECGYSSPKYFGICPECSNGVGVEVDVQVTSSATSDAHCKKSRAHITPSIKRASSQHENIPVAFKTKYPELNDVISGSGGFVDSQVVLLAASPGVGKSTLCTSICGPRSLYISTEENYSQVNNRFARVNPDSETQILSTNNFDELMAAVEQADCDLVVIDSLNNIEFGASYQRVARMAQEITSAIKDRGLVGIIISQVTKQGNVSGMNTIEHVVDTVMFLERSSVSTNVVAVCNKNRFGEIGSIAVFEHESDGFVEVPYSSQHQDLELASTYCSTHFGYKKMDVLVEALVAPCEGPKGIRRSNGYHQGRVQQIAALLNYFGGDDVNLGDQDVYITISQGILVQDTSLDLAVANSILSSYYGEALCNHASGEISLNGTIKHGVWGGKQVKHVHDVIRAYQHACVKG